MENVNDMLMAQAGYEKVYDYSQYAHDNNVNVIPAKDFKRLVQDTFKSIVDIMKQTYGPYGSSMIITDQGQTTTTKDGYNVFQAIQFSHSYKKMVYRAIMKIIERVNKNVGDGTTSCILLASNMFNELENIVGNLGDKPDFDRDIINILTDIEKSLQDMNQIEQDKKDGYIRPLTPTSLKNLIRVASNYDDELTQILYATMDPEVDDNGNITSLRNVIPESDGVFDGDSAITYSYDFLPGDYRMRVHVSVEDAMKLAEVQKYKIVIYDHVFGRQDWIKFINSKTYNSEMNTIILAPGYSHGFLSQEWQVRRQQIERKKIYDTLEDNDDNIILAHVKGEHVNHEIQDIAYLLGTDARKPVSGEINHDELPVVNISIFNLNCLVFHDMPRDHVDEYIDKLQKERESDPSKSYVKTKICQDRVNAVSMNRSETLLTVKCGTTLESKLIMDKIDDCVSIANSALCYGIVPNLFVYAIDRLCRLTMDYDDLGKVKTFELIDGAIMNALEQLEDIINITKHPDEKMGTYVHQAIADPCNPVEYHSYDYITEKVEKIENLPTSSQYDIEVVVAAISIVKYLITSRGLIFDAHIMPTVADDGHYSQR